MTDLREDIALAGNPRNLWSERSVRDGDVKLGALGMADALGAALEHRLPDRIDLLFFDPPYPLMRQERSAERVLGQFGRLIGHLSDDGFAVLRTPWPYVVEVSAPPGLGAAGPSGRRSGRRREEEEEFFEDLDDLSEAMEEEAEEANPAAERRPGNLKVPGAAGPECHPYGSTALQLYMRERKSGGDSGEAAVQSTP